MALQRTDQKYILSFYNTDSPQCIARTRFYHLYKRGGSRYFRPRPRGGLANFTPIAGMDHLISEPKFKIPTPPPPLLISDNSLIVALCNTAIIPFIVVIVVADNDAFYTGFTCPPTIHFKLITKCLKCYYRVRQFILLRSAMVCNYKVRQLFYYKVRQVLLKCATILLQRAIGITKCDRTT